MGALRLDDDLARTIVDDAAAVRRGEKQRPMEDARRAIADELPERVSERIRVDGDREQSLLWLRAVLEQCPVGLMLVYGRPGEWADANERAEQMFGRKVDGVEHYASVIRAPDGRPLEHDEIPSVRAMRGEHVDGEYLLYRDDGSTMPVLASGAPILGPDGARLGAVVTYQDITAAKELERLRAEWSSVVAHDLRQPLGAIHLAAQAIVRCGTDDATVIKNAGRIQTAANRMTRMVGDLMDLSRLEAGRLELVRERVDVPALVRTTVETLALEESGHPFELRLRGDVAPAWADPDRVAQILENLLTNAVKYATAGTPVFVKVEREGDDVAVVVCDEGEPIAPNEIVKIFDRFHRTSAAKLEGIEGVGLGLYITRSLVEAHGGRITAGSTPAGVTTFRFTLPVADVTAKR